MRVERTIGGVTSRNGARDEKDGIQERLEDSEASFEPGVKKSGDLSTSNMPKYQFRPLKDCTLKSLGWKYV